MHILLFIYHTGIEMTPYFNVLGVEMCVCVFISLLGMWIRGKKVSFLSTCAPNSLEIQQNTFCSVLSYLQLI